MQNTEQILNKDNHTFDDLVFLLQLNKQQAKPIFDKAKEIKNQYIGNKVYFRGLIELSNICRKDCLYCGIRKSNKQVERYNLTDQEVLECAQYAYEKQFGSIVIQSGERTDNQFTERITNLIKQIKKLSNQKLGITLSLGEQTQETYQKWFDAGAHRYLLRIEEANKDLYLKLHPNDKLHDFDDRLNCLHTLRKIGYQVGTGVMIGLPFQTVEDLANDLLFMKNFDIDMCGMGPYIEHEHTPLYQYKDTLWTLDERLFMTFKMLALLRIIMKDINIAATTALQAIDPMGREKAITFASNIIMPNITPGMVRKNYLLYENKPCTDENADDCIDCLRNRIKMAGAEHIVDQWGDSRHFFNRQS